MSAELTEAQIVRFSRQILLREVGGAGQRKLLSARLRLEGGGPALWTAAAYAQAGGSLVQTPPPDQSPAVLGFAAGLEEAGAGPAPQAVVLTAGSGAKVPEAVAAIVLGGRAAAFGTADTCRRCLEALVERWPGPDPRSADLLGALAALIFQRGVLRGADEGMVHWTARGGLERSALPRCERCG